MRHAPLILAGLVFILLWFIGPAGTSLIPLMLLTSVASGSVAVVAAGRLSNAKWIAPLEAPLLAMAPLLFIPAIYFHSNNIDLYAWSKHPDAWLNPQFFSVRNALVFLLALGVGEAFKRAVQRNSTATNRWAAAYLLAFVAALSFVAFDWVMSFDHPWISTMFGPLFMVEAFYAGLALAGILCGVGDRDLLHSLSTLTFGFSIFWGGLFFAQYLTIWYGNLPEEVGYFARRFALPGGGSLFWGTLIFLFFVPFLTLLTNPPRRNPAAVAAASGSIFLGIFLERLFYLLPHVHFDPVWLPVKMLSVIAIVALAVREGLRSKG